jgi:hypothetical protein
MPPKCNGTLTCGCTTYTGTGTALPPPGALCHVGTYPIFRRGSGTGTCAVTGGTLDCVNTHSVYSCGGQLPGGCCPQ